MNWSSGLTWLAALAVRRGEGFADTDRADMGTAFGLDASIAAIGELSHVSGSLTPQRDLGPWERRIVRRSGL